jgi:hypothetical protein
VPNLSSGDPNSLTSNGGDSSSTPTDTTSGKPTSAEQSPSSTYVSTPENDRAECESILLEPIPDDFESLESLRDDLLFFIDKKLSSALTKKLKKRLNEVLKEMEQFEDAP